LPVRTKAPQYALILAGGRGTRFWPRSRRSRAKQVLRFDGVRSLIQQTVDRLRPVVPAENIWVLTNDHLRKEIIRQLPEVPARQIIAEPAQRNTAPAIALAAHIMQGLHPDAVMGVFPADHLIANNKRYLQHVRAAYAAAASGNIAVLGIQPRWAETGFGYIEFPAGSKAGTLLPSPVQRFREKPDAATAEKFLQAGNFCWNAGMFFWKASLVLDELRQHLPATAKLISSLPAFRSRSFATDLARIFPKCEDISIDFAVLEKAKAVTGFMMDEIGWNDVGSWNAVYELRQHDAQANASRSDALFFESSGNYVDAEGKLVTLLGVKDLIIVDTPDALLIADRNRAQDVSKLVKELEKKKRNDLL
jgi:mannose-1-phosphate guanylyltransferase